MKTNWKDYFTFSRKERNGILILIVLIAALLAVPYFFTGADAPQLVLDTALQKQFEAFEKGDTRDNYAASFAADTTPATAQAPAVKLFKFDPNTLDGSGFKQLGLPDKNIRTLINYRSKGGHFYKPDDLKKVYGLSEHDADRLIPYVQIKQTASETFYDKPSTKTPAQEPKANTLSAGFKLDINKATPEEWKQFPGIGDVLANRIVKYRYSRQGFTSVDDVAKTYGISDSLFQTMKPHLVINQ